MQVATANFFLLLTGFILRNSNRKAHAILMGLGILSDLVLVLTLQIQRNAVETALAFKLSFLNQAHIFTSALATTLYFPMVFLGFALYFAPSDACVGAKRTLHRKIGWVVLVLRTLGFVLMFSMLGSHRSGI